MGFLKQMKDMKKTVEAAPGMIQQAQAMSAQAQQLGAAQQQAGVHAHGNYGATGAGAGGLMGGSMGGFGAMAAGQQQQADLNRANAAAGAAAVGVDVNGGLAPISGVTIEQFAAVSKGLAAYNYDQTKASIVAEQHGIPAVDWATASAGWNGRVTADPAVAQAFNAAYRAI